MLSRSQQILLKRAQAQAGIADPEYRELLGSVTKLPGCRSSKDGRLADEHLDVLLSFFEAIYWREVDGGRLDAPAVLAQGDAQRLQGLPFRARGFWQGRNRRGNTSRDRFAEEALRTETARLEQRLHEMGFGFGYVQAIRNKIVPFDGWKYKRALERTIAAKGRKKEEENQPF